MAEPVTIFEMGPRDGLQNEKRPIPTADKIRLVDLLTACGFAKIEVASFVGPKWVPQMADGAEVLAGIKRGAAQYAALTPNLQGYQRARAAEVDEVALSDTVGQGTPGSIEAMLQGALDLAPIERFAAHLHDTNGRALDNIEVCLDHGLRTFDSAVAGLDGCPYAPGARGNVATDAVVDLLERRGFATGIDRDRLAEATAFAATLRSSE